MRLASERLAAVVLLAATSLAPRAQSAPLQSQHHVGGATREALYVDLRAGERYALICQFRDQAGAPQHAQRGMVALLEVR